MNNKLFFKVAFVALIFSFIGSYSMHIIRLHYFDVQPAVVRIDEILSRHIKNYGERNLTKEQQEQISSVFAQSLEKQIQTISKEQRVTLFAAGAVATKLPDYTDVINDQIERDIENALRHKAF